jgi:hypothetical protein
MIRPGAVVLCLLAAAGCAPREVAPPSTPAIPEFAADLCDAGRYAGLAGQDGTALERVLLLGQVRVIRPGDAVTMDLRPERINFEIGTDGRIGRVFCG